jgi:hypothetical protein
VTGKIIFIRNKSTVTRNSENTKRAFYESRLSHILGNTTFSNPVNILLPNFTIYKNKMDHIVASDQRSHSSLKKMAARVKQQNIIYSSLAESMLDGEIKIDDNYWSLTNNIISIIAITTTFVNAILIFWLFYKFRILAAMISLYYLLDLKRLCYPECVIVEIHKKKCCINAKFTGCNLVKFVGLSLQEET